MAINTPIMMKWTTILFLMAIITILLSSTTLVTSTTTTMMLSSDDLDMSPTDFESSSSSSSSYELLEYPEQPYIPSFHFISSIDDTLHECQGELQCWLNKLVFALPTLPYNISGIVGNMTNFQCSNINIDSLSSGLNPPPYPEPEDVTEFHMGAVNAGLICKGTFYYNMTAWNMADWSNFTAIVDRTNLGLQVYVQSDGFAAKSTRQGECSLTTHIDLQFEGSISALILELLKKPLIDMMTNLIQDNFCLVTRDLVNITMTQMIESVNQLIAPTLEPHKPLSPVTKEASGKSIAFGDLQIFHFLDRLLNGDENGGGILSNPDPINCIVGLFTNHTGDITIPTYNNTDPTAFMPNVTLAIPQLGNITVGLPSLTVNNLNTIQSLKLLHNSPSDSFAFNNGIQLGRLKIFLNVSMIIELNQTISKTALHENFLVMIDMTKPNLGLDIRSVVDLARLKLAKLGGFCQSKGFLPCLLSLFQGTWPGNGGLQLAGLGLDAKFAMGIKPLAPSDSQLEKDLDMLLNNLVMSLSEKFAPLFTKLVFGLTDNIVRGGINDLLISLGEHATEQCDAVTPHWDGKSRTPLIWKKSILYKLFNWIIHDLLKGVDGINDFVQCAWHGGSVGPDHDFDKIIIPNEDEVRSQWYEHWKVYNATYNITNAPLMEVFNNTIRGLDSLYKLEFFKPMENNETHHDNDFRLFGEFGFGESPSGLSTSSNTCAKSNGLFDDDDDGGGGDDEICQGTNQVHHDTTFSLANFKMAELSSEIFMDQLLDMALNSPESNGNTLSITQREELYGEYIQNMINSHKNTVNYMEKLTRFQLKNTQSNTSSHNDIMGLIQQFLLDTQTTKSSNDNVVVKIMNGVDIVKTLQESDDEVANDDLINKFLQMITDLNTIDTTTTTIDLINAADDDDNNNNNNNNNNDNNNNDFLQYNDDDQSGLDLTTNTAALRWGFMKDDPTPPTPTPQGPLKLWLSLAVPISRRYLLINTTVVIDSFEIDGTAFLQINKDNLYDLTLAKTFSLCLPSVLDQFHFESFNGHVKALTLVLDVLMDPRAKLFHQQRTGPEFAEQVNKAFANEAFPVIANITSTVFNTLVWASTYSCRGEPIPGAPKIVDNLKHSIVEWLAVAIPGGTVIAFILYSFILLTTQEGKKNWAKFFCRAGRGSSKGHVVLSHTDTNTKADNIETQYMSSKPSGSNESFKIKATTGGGNITLESTASRDNNKSLPLSINNDAFVEEFEPITLPSHPAYGILNLGSINGYEEVNEEGSYQPPPVMLGNSNNNINFTTPRQSFSKPHVSNPNSFPEPTDKAALINLNTLSLESGLSIDLLTGSSLLHSPTLPLLIRVGMVVALLTNALLFLVSNMSNGAAVTLIITLFESEYDFGTIFNFTLISTIEDMWKAKVYVLFVLIGAFSGFLPYFKIFLMLIAWCVPTHKLSTQWREFILVWLDRLGKFSLLDAFVFCLMFVAFRMHLPVFGENMLVDSIVRSDPGFYFFLLATMISMGLSHISLALHRHSLTPYVVEKGGPVRSLRQHYHTLFIIDQQSPHYSEQQEDLLKKLPECEEYRELLAERKERRRQEDDRYKKNLEKLGYTSISVTSLDPYNVGLNSDSNNNSLTSSPSSFTTSPSNLSMFEQVDPITGQPLQDRKMIGNKSHTTSGICPSQTSQQYAIKLRLSTLGAILFTSFFVLTLVITVYGCIVDTFQFRFGGISGWLLGDGWDTNDWSIWTVGKNITLSSRDPTTIGIHWIQATYFVFAMLMPIAFLILMTIIFLFPFTLKTHKALHVLVEVFFAWSGVDVFIISILAAVLQISQLAESLVGDKCDFLLSFLHDYMHDALEGHDKCFVVLAKYKSGSIYLIFAAILIILLGVAAITLSASALTDRMNKYFRLIQYSLYQRQVHDGTSDSRLIPFHHSLEADGDNKGNKLIDNNHPEAIVATNNKNSGVVHIVQTIIQHQHQYNTPIDRIPIWFGLMNLLSRCGIVELSRSDVIEDVFGWGKSDGDNEYGWSSQNISEAISDSTMSESSPRSPIFSNISPSLSPANHSPSPKQQSKKAKKSNIGIYSNDDNVYSITRSSQQQHYEPSLTTAPRNDSFEASHLEPV